MTWTQFWDMHSGGGMKVAQYEMIYIEAPRKEAELIFYNRFGRNPNRITCTCCGTDYSIDEEESIKELTGFHRGCRSAWFDSHGNEVTKDEAWESGKGIRDGYRQSYVEEPEEKERSYRPYISIEDYVKKEDVLFIFQEQITEADRMGYLPEEGYIWYD